MYLVVGGRNTLWICHVKVSYNRQSLIIFTPDSKFYLILSSKIHDMTQSYTWYTYTRLYENIYTRFVLHDMTIHMWKINDSTDIYIGPWWLWLEWKLEFESWTWVCWCWSLVLVLCTVLHIRNIQVCSVQVRESRVGKIFGRLKKFSM